MRKEGERYIIQEEDSDKSSPTTLASDTQQPSEASPPDPQNSDPPAYFPPDRSLPLQSPQATTSTTDELLGKPSRHGNNSSNSLLLPDRQCASPDDSSQSPGELLNVDHAKNVLSALGERDREFRTGERGLRERFEIPDEFVGNKRTTQTPGADVVSYGSLQRARGRWRNEKTSGRIPGGPHPVH